MSSSGKTSIIKKYLREETEEKNQSVNVKFSEKKKTVPYFDKDTQR